jgi:hypothetical protein
VVLSLIVIVIFCGLPELRAQSEMGGSVAGQVSGLSGNHFRALVTLRNAATGAEVRALSDAAGHFRFAEVEPGVYSARVNAPGTAIWHASNIMVEIGRTTFVDPRMTVAFFSGPPGRASYSPGTDLTPAVSSNVGESYIDALPSTDGHWSAFADLAAGSAPVISEDESGVSARSFRGLSPAMNGIRLDGVDNSVAFRARERGVTGGGYITARAAVSQFRVSSSNFSAESGGAAGGFISSVTRSGSNRLHATATFLERNAAWGAANAYARVMEAEPAGTKTTADGAPVQYLNGQPITYVDQPYKAPDRRMQFGVDGGGPIRRNKLFWFFAGDYSRRDHPAVARAAEPEIFFAPPSSKTIQTLAARISTSSNPIYTNCPGASLNARASCAYTAVLNQLGSVLGQVPRTSRQIILFPKIDWRYNSRIHLSGEYNLMRRDSPNGVLYGATATDGMGSFGVSRVRENSAVGRLEYFLAPAVLSNARYQYSRDLLSQMAAEPTDFEKPFAANSYGRSPEISIDTGAGFNIGALSSEGKAQYPLETRQQFVDAISWIHGLHDFRFGYDYSHVSEWIDGVANQSGEYSYSSLANFVADLLAPDRCDGTTTGVGDYPCYSWFRQTLGSSVWNFQTADYAAYFSDDWQLTPRLTLSLGVRYDYERLPDTNKLVVNPDIPQTAYLPHDRNNFGPRVGFAWDVFGSGHTILRGGYGLYYARVPNATVFNALTSTGSARSARSYFYRPLDAGAPQFPYVFAANETPYTDPNAADQLRSRPNAVYFDQRFQNPQIHQAELSLEQRLGRGSSVTATLMASEGRELPQYLDRNIDLSAVAPVNYVLDFSTNPQHLGPIQQGFTLPFYYQRLNPSYGPITDILSEANSSYQGAIVRFTRRAARGIGVHVTYTWSHAIDDNQSSGTFAKINTVYDPAKLGLEHGTSNFDLRQRVSGAVIAHVPWRLEGWFGKVADGYTFSALGEWRTGLPYTMRTEGSVPTPLCSNYDWLAAGGPDGGSNCLKDVTAPGGVITDGARPAPGLGATLNGSGGEDLIPLIGRNTFRAPGAVGLDLRASKRTSITERIGVEFFAEALNVLNHRNVTRVQNIGYRLHNQSKSGAYPYANTVSLVYQSGLKTQTVVDADGQSHKELIGSPTAAFGETINSNSTGLYHDRKIQVGCRLYF